MYKTRSISFRNQLKSKDNSRVARPKREKLPLRQKNKKQTFNFLSSSCNINLQKKKKRKEKIKQQL